MSKAKAATKGTTFAFKDDTLTVGPKCGDDAGYWVCTTHGESFPNNLSKDGHVESPGNHVLAWYCTKHGPEVP